MQTIDGHVYRYRITLEFVLCERLAGIERLQKMAQLRVPVLLRLALLMADAGFRLWNGSGL